MAVNPLLLLIALPFLGIVLLVVVLNRWGKRRDPMGGSWKDVWKAPGTQNRNSDRR